MRSRLNRLILLYRLQVVLRVVVYPSLADISSVVSMDVPSTHPASTALLVGCQSTHRAAAPFPGKETAWPPRAPDGAFEGAVRRSRRPGGLFAGERRGGAVRGLAPDQKRRARRVRRRHVHAHHAGDVRERRIDDDAKYNL